jgi:N-acyl homoserine lactone hydrolase
MRPRHPITRVSWSAPGRCRSTPTRGIDLKANLPLAAHLTTLDQAAAHQRLRRRAPRRHHAVRHRQDRASVTDPGYFPGAATGILYDRLARFDIGPGNTLTARLEAIATTSPMCELRCCPISTRTTSTGCRNSAMPPQTWSAARSGRSYNNRWEPHGLLCSHIQLPGLHWRRIELAPTDDPGLVPFTAGHPLFGDGSLVLPPTPGHTSGSLSMLVRRPGRPWLLLVGDLTYDAHLLEHGHLPGVSSWTICRARCAG